MNRNLYMPHHLQQVKMLYSAAVHIADVGVHAHSQFGQAELVLCLMQWAEQYSKTASLLQFVFLQWFVGIVYDSYLYSFQAWGKNKA